MTLRPLFTISCYENIEKRLLDANYFGLYVINDRIYVELQVHTPAETASNRECDHVQTASGSTDPDQMGQTNADVQDMSLMGTTDQRIDEEIGKEHRDIPTNQESVADESGMTSQITPFATFK